MYRTLLVAYHCAGPEPVPRHQKSKKRSHCAALRSATALSRPSLPGLSGSSSAPSPLLKPVLRIAHVVDAVMPSMPLVAAGSSRKSGGRAVQPCIREIAHCHTAALFDSSDKDNSRVEVPKSYPNSQSASSVASLPSHHLDRDFFDTMTPNT
ncbi:hypothetical protein GGP41_008096 [Bipolaris sorokiniana]|uniref:Uncharacterized protein n=1 Tax=Cochliobolus sativus TaxID=45130 RepID=A0A8H6DY39_COCSA|nr:hypothetical protein GGP41_008096 [Bipolaris sorokiniana]